MHKVTNELADLLQRNGPTPAVTIYAPTYRTATPPHMREDEIRFKKLAHKASSILHNIDKHDPFNATFAAQCAALLGTETFWENRAEAMLVCARPGQFEVNDLPMTTDEYAAVDDHYHLAPVFELLEDAISFYVLAVTRDGAFLFAGDEYGLRLAAQESFLDPHRSKDSEVIYEAERHRDFRSVDKKFFTKADKTLPLILAGVSSDIAEYRSLSTYPRILEQHIPGSYGADSGHELFLAGVPIMREVIVEAQHRARLADYQRLKHERPELASDDIADITKAAERGRIDTLLIGMSRHTADAVDDNTRPVKKIIFPDEIECRVIDYLVRPVREQGGHIINVDEEHLPGPARLYAIYRY